MQLPASFPIQPLSIPAARYAAGELSRYLGKMSGGEYPVTEDASGFALRMAEDAALAPGAFRLTVAKEGIRLWASDLPPNPCTSPRVS